MSKDIAAALDELAKRIQSATDYPERDAAVVSFQKTCLENVPPLNPAIEGVKRNVALLNPLKLSSN